MCSLIYSEDLPSLTAAIKASSSDSLQCQLPSSNTPLERSLCFLQLIAFALLFGRMCSLIYSEDLPSLTAAIKASSSDSLQGSPLGLPSSSTPLERRSYFL